MFFSIKATEENVQTSLPLCPCIAAFKISKKKTFFQLISILREIFSELL